MIHRLLVVLLNSILNFRMMVPREKIKFCGEKFLFSMVIIADSDSGSSSGSDSDADDARS